MKDEEINIQEIMPADSKGGIFETATTGRLEKKDSQQAQDLTNSKAKGFVSSIIKMRSFRSKVKRTILRNKRIVRKEQNIIAYILTVICTSLMGTENLYLFLWSYEGRDRYIFFPTLILRPILFLTFSYSLCRDLRVLRKLYFCFDRIFLAGFASTLSVVIYSYFFLPLTNSPWIYYSMFGLAPLLNLSFSGYCRVLMVFCKWKAWQTILFKLAVVLGGTAYFGLGIYYTIVDGQFTDGASPKLDNIILELLFLYAFAGFDFHIEIISMVDDTDGTTENKSNYKLELAEEDMQVLMHGRLINSESILNSNHQRLMVDEI